MVKEYSMSNSLAYEKSKFVRQDRFYMSMSLNTKIISVDEIHRYDYDDEEGRKMQRKDIDLTLKYTDENGQHDLNISEKSRERYYPDLLFEVYSAYETKVPGWSETSESEMLAYFTPERVIVGDERKLKELYMSNSIRQQVDDSVELRELVSGSGPARKNIRLKIGNENVGCVLLKAVNKSSYGVGNYYTTVSVAIPFDTIKKYTPLRCYNVETGNRIF